MNADQRNAVSAVLQMRDYALILGMPGTGKTSTIVHAIQGLLAAGKTVLLTAYTNSAVDNIALKLISAGIEFVRVPGGSEQAVHPDVRPFIPGGDRYPDGNTMTGLTNIIATVRVVAVVSAERRVMLCCMVLGGADLGCALTYRMICCLLNAC